MNERRVIWPVVGFSLDLTLSLTWWVGVTSDGVRAEDSALVESGETGEEIVAKVTSSEGKGGWPKESVLVRFEVASTVTRAPRGPDEGEAR